jgi:transcriptional regulator with XRE-family HTH domain
MAATTIALKVKQIRKERALTLDTLARKVGVTKGYLSQVENLRTMPSLPILYKLAEALDVSPGDLLGPADGGVTHVKTRAGDGPVVEREYPESGFVYRALAEGMKTRMMEPFRLEMPPHSTRKIVTTNGDEFLFVLNGSIVFCLGKERIPLAAGDSLYFRGEVPHHPENETGDTAVLVVVYSLRSS